MADGMYGGRRFYRQTDEKPRITRALIFRIIGCFAPYWKLMLIMGLAIVAVSSLGLVPPILTKNIIDIALPHKDIRLLVYYILLSFGTTLLLNLISVGQSYLNSLISKNIIRDLRSRMYGHLQNMPMSFFSNVKTGEINSRINNDIGGIENIFANTFIQILQSVIVFVTTALTLFYTNWILAIVSLLVLPLFLPPTRKVGKVRWDIASKLQAKLAELTTIITETLNVSGSMLVKLFTNEKAKKNEFDNVNREVTRLGIRENLAGRWFFMTIRTFTSIGPMLIYLAGGIILIRYGTLTVGGIVMFVTLLGRLYGPVSTISNIHVDIIRSMALFERIFQYLDLKAENPRPAGAKTLEDVKGRIRFENVDFSYDNKVQVLKGINIDIKPGQIAAFVGPSGAGKTTITYLVPRLYDVTGGAVTIDGLDIRTVTLESLRRQIGMVTQDTYLFNDTIRNNLLFAKADATQEEIEAACRAANIHDLIISLPEGYDTVVGDRGIKLSGGEKQRISIARTLLKNPKIVIFDEATSALDSASETLVQQAIEPLLKGRTSLVIAHRLSTVISADIIYVVKDGEIVERGTHPELLEKNGVYRELYDKQFKKGRQALNV